VEEEHRHSNGPREVQGYAPVIKDGQVVDLSETGSINNIVESIPSEKRVVAGLIYLFHAEDKALSLRPEVEVRPGQPNVLHCRGRPSISLA